MFYLKTTYQKMVKAKDTQFCVKNLKMKKKDWPSGAGIWTPDFQ